MGSENNYLNILFKIFILSSTEEGGVLGGVGLKYKDSSFRGELYLRPTPPSTLTFQLDLV